MPAKVIKENWDAAIVITHEDKQRLSAIVMDPVEAYYRLSNDSVIGADIETSGLSPWHDKIGVISLYGKETKTTAVIQCRFGSIPPQIKALLERINCTFIWHNGVCFDLPFLHTHGVDVFKATHVDTMIAEQATISTGRRDISASLAAALKRRENTTLDKSISHGGWLNDTLNERQLLYCAGDIQFLPQLYETQRLQASSDSRINAIDFEMRLIPAVLTMIVNGLPIDLPTWKKFIADQKELANQQEKFVADLLGRPINFNSPKQVVQALLDVGVDLGGSSSDLLQEELLGADPELTSTKLINAILICRGALKRSGMYSEEWISKYMDKQGKIHSRFKQLGTDTGRFTSTDPNLQQIPQDGRCIFGGVPGHKIVWADYSQIEVRVAATLAKDETMIEAFGKQDIHRFVASKIFKKPEEEITKEERSKAKAAVFTLLFGGGASGLVAYARKSGSALDISEANKIVRDFFHSFQGLARTRQAAFIKSNSGSPIVMKLPTGLRRVTVGKILPTQLLNTTVQGTAAAGLKHSLILAHEKGLTKYIGAVVHDEIVATVPNEFVEEFSRGIKECMVLGMQKVIEGTPIDVSVKAADFWGH